MENESTITKLDNLSLEDQIQSKQIATNINKDININKYNIDKILLECEDLKDTEFLKYVAKILKEPRLDLITAIYNEMGKNFIVINLEKAMIIENSGGMKKLLPNKNHENKTIGGIFFYLMKTQDNQIKNIIKRLFRINYKERNQRKKMYRKMQHLTI
jgi:hypothetical protein